MADAGEGDTGKRAGGAAVHGGIGSDDTGLAFARLRKVLVLLVLVIVGGYTTITVRFLSYTYQNDLAEVERATANLARTLGEHAAATLGEADQVLQGIATRYRADLVRSHQPPDTYRTLLRMLADRMRQTRSLALIDATGRLIASSQADGEPGRTAMLDFVRVHSDAPGTGLFVGKATGHGRPLPSVYLSRRVDAADGHLIGVVVAELETEYFATFFQSIELGRLGLIAISRNDGEPLYQFSTRRPTADTPDPGNLDIVLDEWRAAVSMGLVAASQSDDGIERIVSKQSVGGLPLQVAVGVAVDEALSKWWRGMLVQVSVAAIIATVTVLLAALFALSFRRLENSHARLVAAEQALQESEKKYAALFGSSADAVLLIEETSGRIVEANPSAVALYGEVHSTLLSRSLADLVATVPSEPADPLRGIHTAGPEETLLHRRGDGTTFPVDVTTGSAVVGGRQMVVASVRDVTERQRREEVVRESEARFRTAFEQAPHGMALLSFDGRWLRVNQALRTIVGLDEEAMLAGRLDAVAEPAAAQAYGRWAAGYVRDGGMPGIEVLPSEMFQREMVLRHRNGDEVPVLFTSSVVAADIDGLGGVTGHVIAQVQDISLLKRQERELQRARDEAERADQAKSVFLANMSHEIRTPLNAIIGLTRLLRHAGLAADQKAQVQTIATAGETLLDVLDDILDFSRIEDSRIEIERRPFELRPVAFGIVALLTPEARRKGLSLTLDVGRTVPAWVMGDSGRLRQVLLNLVGNAVKFTHQGGITVGIERAREAGDSTGGENATEASGGARGRGPGRRGGPVCLSFSVSDTGIGIPPEARARLFEKFSQLDPSISRVYGGSGLGLAISKGLVELMGGQITVESMPGEGTTFRFDLTVDRTAAPKGDGADAAPLPPLSVLVVDDDEVNRMVAAGLLEQGGHRVSVAADGLEALTRVREHDYDVVLMDLRMPGMDGWAATRAIRGLDDTRRATVPVVVMSAQIVDAREETLQAAGVNGFVPKPVQPTRLDQVLRAVLSGSRPGRGRRGLGRASSSASASVPVINPEVLAGHAGRLGVERAGRIVDTFRETTPELMARIEAALTVPDLPAAADSAHRLKGAAESLGLTLLGGLAHALNTAALSGVVAEATAQGRYLATAWPRSLEELDRTWAGLMAGPEAPAEPAPAAPARRRRRKTGTARQDP